MLQAANTDLFNPLVLEAHSNECQNVPFNLQTSQLKLQFADFYLCTVGTNGLNPHCANAGRFTNTTWDPPSCVSTTPAPTTPPPTTPEFNRSAVLKTFFVGPNTFFSPLMPKRYYGTSIKFILLKKQMSQAANTDLFNPLLPKAHNSERQNLLFPLQIIQFEVNLKLSWCIFISAPSALMG